MFAGMGFWRGDPEDAPSVSDRDVYGFEYIFYRYKIGYGKEWEPLFRIRGSNDDSTLAVCLGHYKLEEGEMVCVEKGEKYPGDAKRTPTITEYNQRKH